MAAVAAVAILRPVSHTHSSTAGRTPSTGTPRTIRARSRCTGASGPVRLRRPDRRPRHRRSRAMQGRPATAVLRLAGAGHRPARPRPPRPPADPPDAPAARLGQGRRVAPRGSRPHQPHLRHLHRPRPEGDPHGARAATRCTRTHSPRSGHLVTERRRPAPGARTRPSPRRQPGSRRRPARCSSRRVLRHFPAATAGRFRVPLPQRLVLRCSPPAGRRSSRRAIRWFRTDPAGRPHAPPRGAPRSSTPAASADPCRRLRLRTGAGCP